MYEEITKLIENNELDKALAQIEKLQQNDPKKYNLTGLVYFNKGELGKAKEAFEKGLKNSANRLRSSIQLWLST